MGTGGATALVSPEIYAVLVGTNFWCVIRDSRLVVRSHSAELRFTIHEFRFTNDSQFTLSKNCRFSDIYIRGRDSRFVTPLQRFPDSRFNALTINEFEEHFRASFCFEIIWSLLLTGTGVSDPGYSVTKKKMIKPNGLLVLLS